MNNQNLEIQLGYNSLLFKEGNLVEEKKRNVIFSKDSCMFMPSLQRLNEIGVANAYLIPFKTLEKNGFKQVMLEDIENMSQFEKDFILQKANLNKDIYHNEEDIVFKNKIIRRSRLNRIRKSTIYTKSSYKKSSYKESSNILSAWYKEIEDGVKVYIFARDSDDYTRKILEWSDPCIKKIFNNNEVRMRQDNIRYLINPSKDEMSMEEYFCQLHELSFSTKCSKFFWNNMTWSSYFVFPNETYVTLEDIQETFYGSARLWVEYEHQYFYGFDGFEIVMKDTKEIYSNLKLSGLTLSSDGFWGRLLRFINNDVVMEKRWSLPVNTCDLLKYAPLRIILALFNIIGIISWKRPNLHKDYRGVIEVPYNLRYLTPLYWVYQIKIFLSKALLKYVHLYDSSIKIYRKILKNIGFRIDFPYINNYENENESIIIKSHKVKNTEGEWSNVREYFANERSLLINYISPILSIIGIFLMISPIPLAYGLSLLILSLFLDLSFSLIFVGVIIAITLMLQLGFFIMSFVLLFAYGLYYLLKKSFTIFLLLMSPVGYIFTKIFKLFKFNKFIKLFKKSQGICMEVEECEVPQRKELLWRIFMDIKEKTCTLVEWK